jgi:hypothetical protein
LPEPGDNALTAEERAILAAHGEHDHGHGHAVPAVSGGSGLDEDNHADDDHAVLDHSGRALRMPDLNTNELLTLVPLLVLTIALGVYPGPVMDYVKATFEAILVPFGGSGV